MSTHKIASPRLFDASLQKRIRPAAMDKVVLFKRLKILLICSLFSLAMAAIFRYFSRPVYQITSEFPIDPSRYDQQSALTISNATTADNVQEKLNTEVDFLTSRSNLLNVVRKFNLNVNYQTTGLLQKKELYLESPVDFQRIRMGARGSGRFSLTVKNRESFLFQPEEGKAQEYAFNTTYTDDLGSWQVSKMPNISRYFGRTIRIDVLDPELAADKLQSNLDVTATGAPASTLKLSISDPVLARGNDVLNALLVTYIQNNETEKERLAQGQLRFIKEQLVALDQELSSLNSQLKARSAGLSNPAIHSPAAIQYLRSVKGNDELLSTLNLKIAALTDLKHQFQSQRSGAIHKVNSAVAEPLLNAMAGTLYETEFSYNRLLQTHLPDDPEVTETLQQLQRQKKSLLMEINKRLSNMLQSRKKLIAANLSYAEGISALSPNDLLQISLQRRMQVIPDLYADLLRSKENAALNHASFLAFSKPMNSNLLVTERKHFSLVVLLIAFAISLSYFLLTAILRTGKKVQSNS
jgi:tyrosine-protein kinase Etk/Wzc